jgi:hypothetical protein
VITASRLIAEMTDGTSCRNAFVTLTYRPGLEWSPRHISDYIRLVKRWAEAKRYRLAYVWVAELTKAGRVHYHLILTWWGTVTGQRLVNVPMPDRSTMWRHGMSRIEEPRNPVGYIAKYTSKARGKVQLPRNLRLCGYGGLGLAQRLELQWWAAPRWARRLIPLEEGVRRLKHGWWGNRSTRWAYRTPWTFDLDTLKPKWLGWTWHDVCITGETYAELGGSG